MLDNYGNTNETLRVLAEEAEGLRYDSPEAMAILDRDDWQSHWPVVDGRGLLTGDVVETDDCEEYRNVGDAAMVHRDSVTSSQLRPDGYAVV